MEKKGFCVCRAIAKVELVSIPSCSICLQSMELFDHFLSRAVLQTYSIAGGSKTDL